MKKVNDIVKVDSGMGGSFNVRLVYFDNKTNKWQGKIEMPLNKDWHNYIIWFKETRIIN